MVPVCPSDRDSKAVSRKGVEFEFSALPARAALQLRGWELAVWAKNLNDGRYFAYGTSLGGTQVLLATPRTLGVTVTTRLWQ